VSRIPPRKKPYPRPVSKTKTKLARGMDLVVEMSCRRVICLAAQDWSGLLALSEEYMQHGAVDEANRIIHSIPKAITDE